jgi:hypothetical protein
MDFRISAARKYAVLFSLAFVLIRLAESGILPGLRSQYDIGKWTAQFSIEPTNANVRITESTIVESRNAVR